MLAAAAAAQCWPGLDLDLSAYALAAGRLQLPPPADLLGLCGRSHRPLRPVGRRMDDAGAAAPLPSLRHLRNRQRPRGAPAGRTMVRALALRPLARRQRAVTSD